MNLKLASYLLAFFCVFLLSCNNDEEEKTVAFYVTISDIATNNAKATITHNGTNRNIYYAFVIEGHVDDIEETINKMLTSNHAQQILDNPISQRKRVIQISGLLPGKDFTYIVFGLDDDKHIYGQPCKAEFTTKDDYLEAKENGNWTVTHKGHTVYNDYDYTLVNVAVTDEVKERYFLALYDSSIPNTFNRIEDFIYYAVNDFTNKRNSDGDINFWLDASQVHTESTNFFRYLEPGNYVAYAIGLNADGTPTGSYARCEAFHVDQYPYTDAYADLINDNWYFVDAEDKRYFVTFKPKIVNRSLLMTGWGNYNEFEIPVDFKRATNRLTFFSGQVSDGYVTLKLSGSDKTGTVHLFGAYYYTKNDLRWTGQNHAIAWGELNEDGNYHFYVGYDAPLDGEGKTATELGMSFVMFRDGLISLCFARMMFPFTLTKKE